MELRRWKLFQELDPVFLSHIKCAITVGCEGLTVDPSGAILLLQNGDVYGVGRSVQGCLGIKHVGSTSIPMKIQSLCGKEVTDFYAGFGHVIARTVNGRLYGWGDNKFGQIGQGTPNAQDKKVIRLTRSFPEPVQITETLEGKHITSVACGFNHTLALTDEGEVYGWGFNKDGRVGCDSKEMVVDIPTRLNFSVPARKIQAIACGRHFSMAISSDGNLYAWGSNDYGQIGMKDTKTIWTPKKLQIGTSPFKQIACGPFHALALTQNGQLYFWGHHMLKRNAYTLDTKLPQLVEKRKWLPPLRIADDLDPILDIAASYLVPISVINTEKGVHAWGKCLGHFHDVPTPTHFRTLDEAFAVCPDNAVMWQALHCTGTDKGGLPGVWEKALDDEGTCDIHFEISREVLKAHTLFLWFRSPHLCKVLGIESPAAKPTRTIEVHDVEFSVFKLFLRYLYTDWIDVESTNQVIDLIQIAHRYKEADLLSRCQNLLKSALTLQNLVTFYDLAAKYDAKDLRERCLDFAEANYGVANESSKGKTLTKGGSDVWLAMMKDLKNRKKH